MSLLVAGIEARIEELEAALARAAPLALERERLLRARAALLGEPPPAAFGAVRRVTQDDVAAILEQRAGLRAGEIARALGAGRPAISAHLYRGKNGRFEARGGRWYVRASTRSPWGVRLSRFAQCDSRIGDDGIGDSGKSTDPTRDTTPY